MASPPPERLQPRRRPMMRTDKAARPNEAEIPPNRRRTAPDLHPDPEHNAGVDAVASFAERSARRAEKKAARQGARIARTAERGMPTAEYEGGGAARGGLSSSMGALGGGGELTSRLRGANGLSVSTDAAMRPGREGTSDTSARRKAAAAEARAREGANQ